MSQQIPMVDLRGQYQALKAEIDSGMQAALENAHFILGPNVHAFETEAANYLGVRHAISCANGTDALHLALLAAGIKAGDEVITTPFTFIATAEAIRYVGATPVFVDVDEKTYNIRLDQIEAAITSQTRAIIPVHIFGQPVNMPALMAIAQQHKLLVVEDAAQSFGARINGGQTMSFGDFGCTSFFPSKNLGCFGDGGMVTTNSDKMAERLKMFRNHGSKVRYYHDEIGYNSRLDEIQAVVLRAKLKRIDEYNQGRRRVAALYRECFADTEVVTPHEDGLGEHVYHQYTTITPQREKVQQHLQSKGIACAVYYPIALHQQKAFANDCTGLSMPTSEHIANNCLSYPIFPEMTEGQVKTVCEAIKEALN
jgi:dTDP-4-amino-4,6-dideoxygalactose transaminase